MQRGSVGVCIYMDKLTCEIFSTYVSDHIRENLKWLGGEGFTESPTSDYSEKV
jgi:hypothetical protein